MWDRRRRRALCRRNRRPVRTGWRRRPGDTHTYQFTINGVPERVYDGALDVGHYAAIGGIPVRELPPPPPSAGPEWGPYELLVNGVDVTLGATEDLAVPMRLTAPDCEVPADCRRRWCETLAASVDAMEARSDVLQEALREANRTRTSRPFTVTVASKATETAIDPTNGGCGDCPSCVQMPRAHRVETWALRVHERSDVETSLDDLYSWARHELRATVLLEPTRAAALGHVADRAGGPFGGVLGGVAHLLGGLQSLFGGVLGGGGRPPRRSWIGTPVEASAWLNTGFVSTDEDDRFAVVNGGQAEYGSDDEALSDFGSLAMDFEDGTYELAFPRVPVTGESRVIGVPGEPSELERTAGWGNEIARRASAERGGSAAGTPAAGGEDPTPRFPLTASRRCGSGLQNRVELVVDGEGVVPATYLNTAGVAYPAGATPRGTASVEWELVPRSFESGPAGAIDCY